ncbi:MAG TPA: ABC transporter ATP-binding protein, partial [Caldimonas sp.]
MSSLSLEGVSKHWGTAKAVDGATFATASGQLVILLGPSGCGKSTTLRMIAGLDTPSEGRIVIDGRDVTHLAPAERRISMVFQSYALFPHLSVRENILFGVRVRKEPAADFAKRLARVAHLLGLTALLERKPSQLSGGQQQRVALGRALVRDPQVFLLDEPLSNLDAQLRQEMRREIRTLQQFATPAEIYHRPANVFVAGFIGTPSMTLAEGEIAFV